MTDFVVSARKYRPATFKTVVGQDHITLTLKNAIITNQLAQAFLFCGPRGVGKTTCARILAKTINCTNLTEDNEACNECESCKSFNESASFNIFELDAASNNSVDDIRNLVNQVRIPPQSSRYKVYIIDEVHMLSQAAFNAFLKTLEEPPPYAKFILATTEKHKIIPTILSRCQIFDFKRIKTDDISKHLEYVATQENVAFEPDALHIIAQKSDGGLRDALSMFDQLVNFTSGNLSYTNVIQNLNVLDYDYYFKLVDYFLNGDVSSALLLYQDVIEKGFDGQYFITGLSSHLRNLLVFQDPATHKLLEVSENIRLRYGEQASNVSPEKLFAYLQISNDFDYRYKEANNKRLHIEVALMKMALLDNSPKPIAATVSQTPQVASGIKAQANNITPPANQIQQEIIKQGVSTEKSVEEPPKESVPSPPVEEKKQESKIIMPTKGGTISINKPLEEQNLPSGEKKNLIEKKEVSKEDAAKYWNEFIQNIEEEERYNDLAFAMKLNELEIKNGDTIIYEVQNSLQETEIQKHKMELIPFLREKLGVDRLYLQINIHTEEKEVRPYTPKDKYYFFVEKNPNLNNLRTKLNLDIDY